MLSLPLSSSTSPYKNKSVISQKFDEDLSKYIVQQNLSAEDALQLKKMCTFKYNQSLITPGEAVGIQAGHSVGEPSTQLTLNTFHLAGHGAANVTLGIPRLREIIMTAKQDIKTPLMTVQCPSMEAALQIKNLLSRIQLGEIVEKI